MNTIDKAIAAHEQAMECFVRAGKAEDVAIVLAELAGFREIRDGVPANPALYYGYKARYEQAKKDALILKDERESQP